MSEIIPAILPKSYGELKEKLEHVSHFVSLVQVDVCDGKITPSPSWPYTTGGKETFEAVLEEKDGLPEWQNLDFEFDLMLQNPEEVVPVWIRAGATRIIVHIEAVTDFQKIKNDCGALVELGLAINIDTPIETLKPYISEVAFVQCMGIARIGFQGEPFDSRVLAKIRSLRQLYPELIISVDGGVSLTSGKDLLDAGATRLVAGSAIFESVNMQETIELFKNL